MTNSIGNGTKTKGDEAPSQGILETQALTRRFGKFTAVKGVSLSVQPGEVFGLLGPNGAGKSTLLKMLTTLLPLTAGTATVGGYSIAKQAEIVRHLIPEFDEATPHQT